MKEIFPAKWYLHAAQCTSSSISVTRKWSALRRAASASSARRALSAAFTCRSTVRIRETCGFCTVSIAGVQWRKVRQARALRRLTCSVHRNLARVCLGDVQSKPRGQYAERRLRQVRQACAIRRLDLQRCSARFAGKAESTNQVISSAFGAESASLPP